MHGYSVKYSIADNDCMSIYIQENYPMLWWSAYRMALVKDSDGSYSHVKLKDSNYTSEKVFLVSMLFGLPILAIFHTYCIVLKPV